MSVNDYQSDQPITPRLPSQWSWIAFVIIILLGVVGFVRGLGNAKPLDAILAPVKGLPVVTALTAADAAPLPHNDDWSVLSGPRVLPPPAPRAAKAESSDDDESDAAADQSAAAAQVDAQPPDDAAAPASQPNAPAPGSTPPQ